jgi:hypothetical protein
VSYRMPSRDVGQGLGRGLTIAGAVLLGVYALMSALLLVFLTDGGRHSPLDDGLDKVIPLLWTFWILALPVWTVGVIMIGRGRQRRRGRVKGARVAWSAALAALPTIVVLFVIIIAAAVPFGNAAVYLIIACVVVVIVSPIGAFWLIWGRSVIRSL